MPVHDLPAAFEVGSGGGGADSAARLSGQCDERLRSSATWKNWRSGLPTAGASFANWRSVLVSSVESCTAFRPEVERSPSERNAGRDASENGPSSLKKVKRSGAARRRSASSGFCCVVRSLSFAIVGRSSDRKVGNLRKPSVMSACREAEISAALRAELTQRASCRLLLSS